MFLNTTRVYTQNVAGKHIRCIIKQRSTSQFPCIVLFIYILLDHKLWSTLHILHVFPHTVLHISLLVDHDLWSTLLALYVATFVCTYLSW